VVSAPTFSVAPINGSPGRKLYQAHMRMRQQLTNLFQGSGHGITTEAWAMLSQLWEEDGLSQTELGHRLEKDGPFTSRLVDGLEAQGYLQRRMSDDDRRSRVIALTAKGRAARPALTKIAMRALTNAFEGVPARDYAAFIRTLDHVIRRLDSVRNRPTPRRARAQ
jgi:MarR family transcriptional regulator, organic hydroperoxide resistance regulator